jgi:hypothetical protein
MKTYQLHFHPISILSQFPALGKKLRAAGGGSERAVCLGGDEDQRGMDILPAAMNAEAKSANTVSCNGQDVRSPFLMHPPDEAGGAPKERGNSRQCHPCLPAV